MSNKTSQIAADSFKALFVSLLKLVGIGFSFFLKTVSLVLMKLGELIERVIVKRTHDTVSKRIFEPHSFCF